MIVKNYDNKEFAYTHGLHTYFDVSSLSNVKIEGGFAGKRAQSPHRNNWRRAKWSRPSLSLSIDVE